MALHFSVRIKEKVRAECVLIRAEDQRPIYLPAALGVRSEQDIPELREALAADPDLFRVTDTPPDEGGYAFSWAKRGRASRAAAIEIGFWKSAMHADPMGIYSASTFNTPEGMRQVMAYRPEKPAAELLLGENLTKYRQDSEDVPWEGIVLPLQVPTDRAILSVGTTDEYWTFVEGACKKYGDNLLLKVHPCSGCVDRARAMGLAEKYGTRYAGTNYSCLRRCKFVLVYNSTFAMDAFVLGAPVCQFAPGYWYQSGAVLYTEGEYPDDCDRSTVEVGTRVADFCVWRYCWSWEVLTAAQWRELLTIFARSAQLFPLPECLSYGALIDRVPRTWTYRF